MLPFKVTDIIKKALFIYLASIPIPQGVLRSKGAPQVE
jgi:hypothetical protein